MRWTPLTATDILYMSGPHKVKVKKKSVVTYIHVDVQTQSFEWHFRCLDVKLPSVAQIVFKNDDCRTQCFISQDMIASSDCSKWGFGNNKCFFSCPGSSILSLAEWVTNSRFAIWTQRETFETSDPSDIWSGWCLDKKAERQKEKEKRKRKKTNKKDTKRPKRDVNIVTSGQFPSLPMLFMIDCFTDQLLWMFNFQ